MSHDATAGPLRCNSSQCPWELCGESVPCELQSKCNVAPNPGVMRGARSRRQDRRSIKVSSPPSPCILLRGFEKRNNRVQKNKQWRASRRAGERRMRGLKKKTFDHRMIRNMLHPGECILRHYLYSQRALFGPLLGVLERRWTASASADVLLFFSRFSCIHERSMEPFGVDKHLPLSLTLSVTLRTNRAPGKKCYICFFPDFPISLHPFGRYPRIKYLDL
jgi:hypothetical protein